MFKLSQYFLATLVGLGLLLACTGPWLEMSVLEVGDNALSRPLETNFNADFETSFGLPPSAVVYFASEVDVAEKVMERLNQTLAARHQSNRSELLKAAAHLLGSKVVPEGGFMQRSDGRFIFLNPAMDLRRATLVKPLDEKAATALIRQLPNEFRFYFRSLYSDWSDAARLCEEILALPPEERSNLTVLAAYRLARLNLLQVKWGKLSDAEAKKQLAEVRHGFEEVKRFVKEGNLDLAHFDLAAEGWLAHTYSVVFDPARLQALGEADFARAADTYLKFYKAGEGTAKDSLRLLGQRLGRPEFYQATVHNPTLRRLTTISLSAGNDPLSLENQDPSSLENPAALQAKQELLRPWFLALCREPSAEAFDYIRVAMLQYRRGYWDDCAATLKLCPADDPMVRLLQSRLFLREGKLTQAREILKPALEPSSQVVVKQYHYFANRDLDQEEQLAPYWFDGPLTAEVLLPKLRAEYANLALSQGHYDEALNLFLRTGLSRDAYYLGECVLSLEELKTLVDRDWPEPPELKSKPNQHELEACIEWEPVKEIRSLLARRLFRAGRWQEARPYFVAELRPEVDQYISFIQRAQDSKLNPSQRADAYWRASLVMLREGENLLFCNFGPSWSSASTAENDQMLWYDTPGLPRVRIQPIEEEPESLLAPPSPDEVKRVQSWITLNLDNPNRAHRDARYEVARLALEAAKLLPEQDEAGAKILQFAGNLIKYREPKAAQPLYRLLATKYKKTEWGERARKLHWFAPLFLDPNPDWIQKGS